MNIANSHTFYSIIQSTPKASVPYFRFNLNRCSPSQFLYHQRNYYSLFYPTSYSLSRQRNKFFWGSGRKIDNHGNHSRDHASKSTSAPFISTDSASIGLDDLEDKKSSEAVPPRTHLDNPDQKAPPLPATAVILGADTNNSSFPTTSTKISTTAPRRCINRWLVIPNPNFVSDPDEDVDTEPKETDESDGDNVAQNSPKKKVDTISSKANVLSKTLGVKNLMSEPKATEKEKNGEKKTISGRVPLDKSEEDAAKPLATPAVDMSPNSGKIKKVETNDEQKSSNKLASVVAEKGISEEVVPDEAQKTYVGPEILVSALDVTQRHIVSIREEWNGTIKNILVEFLGSDFSKAGIFNDGLRTSFSVLSTQSVKLATGLRIMPSKLLVSCMSSPDQSFDWIDISAHPTATLTEYREALTETLLELGMHDAMVEDSTEPMLLPQATISPGCYSLVVRYAVETSTSNQMDTFQDLTNRFTILLTKNRIVTVHRVHCPFVEELKVDWATHITGEEFRGPRYILNYFVKEIVATFTIALSKCIIDFDHYEASLFSQEKKSSSLARDIYHIKRRASVFSRTLALLEDAYTHMASTVKMSAANVQYQEVQQDIAHAQTLSEELNGNADSLLQLLFQLSSYQLNELMRVLTIFSAFFIPLSFIASAYGMNFDHMPLIEHPYGHLYCGAMMFSVGVFLAAWFKAKKFI